MCFISSRFLAVTTKTVAYQKESTDTNLRFVVQLERLLEVLLLKI